MDINIIFFVYTFSTEGNYFTLFLQISSIFGVAELRGLGVTNQNPQNIEISS